MSACGSHNPANSNNENNPSPSVNIPNPSDPANSIGDSNSSPVPDSTTQSPSSPNSDQTPTSAVATPVPMPSNTHNTNPEPIDEINICNTVEKWSTGKTYVGGTKVVYQNQIWVASWWSYGDVPGGPVGVWSQSGTC